MIPQVTSVEAAMNWFLSHSSGQVCCVKENGDTKVVDNFPDAKAFFEG